MIYKDWLCGILFKRYHVVLNLKTQNPLLAILFKEIIAKYMALYLSILLIDGATDSVRKLGRGGSRMK